MDGWLMMGPPTTEAFNIALFDSTPEAGLTGCTLRLYWTISHSILKSKKNRHIDDAASNVPDRNGLLTISTEVIPCATQHRIKVLYRPIDTTASRLLLVEVF